MGAEEIQAGAPQKPAEMRARLHAAMRAAAEKGCANLPGCAFRDEHVETILCDELVLLLDEVRSEGVRVGRAAENEACEKIRGYRECADETCTHPVCASYRLYRAAIVERWRP